MTDDRTAEAAGGRERLLRGAAMGLAWALVLVLFAVLVVRDVDLRDRVEVLEARAGALEAIARRQRGLIAELQAEVPAGEKPEETVALVIEMAGPDFPQVIVRAGIDTGRERRVVLLLPSQDRQRLEAVRAQWPTLSDEEKERQVGVLTAAVEEGIRRELPALFVPRQDIQEALESALDVDAGATDRARAAQTP